jgi:hypothetical protein
MWHMVITNNGDTDMTKQAKQERFEAILAKALFAQTKQAKQERFEAILAKALFG